jgi:hypothetical protein
MKMHRATALKLGDCCVLQAIFQGHGTPKFVSRPRPQASNHGIPSHLTGVVISPVVQRHALPALITRLMPSAAATGAASKSTVP